MKGATRGRNWGRKKRAALGESVKGKGRVEEEADEEDETRQESMKTMGSGRLNTCDVEGKGEEKDDEGI